MDSRVAAKILKQTSQHTAAPSATRADEYVMERQTEEQSVFLSFFEGRLQRWKANMEGLRKEWDWDARCDILKESIENYVRKGKSEF